MRVVAFSGPSDTQKTTTICALIRHLRARGSRVAAIKHTHHELNDSRAGDTGRFAECGASPVILAAEGEAVIFDARTRRVAYSDPADLLQFTAADFVLVEGFKDFRGWPRASNYEDALRLLDTID